MPTPDIDKYSKKMELYRLKSYSTHYYNRKEEILSSRLEYIEGYFLVNSSDIFEKILKFNGFIKSKWAFF